MTEIETIINWFNSITGLNLNDLNEIKQEQFINFIEKFFGFEG
jgi:hypothetical protein